MVPAVTNSGKSTVLARRLHTWLQIVTAVIWVGTAIFGMVVTVDVGRHADGPLEAALAPLAVAVLFTPFYTLIALAMTWPLGTVRLVIDWDTAAIEVINFPPGPETRVTFDELRSCEVVQGLGSVSLKGPAAKGGWSMPILAFSGVGTLGDPQQPQEPELPAPLEQLVIDLLPWRSLPLRSRLRAVAWPFRGLKKDPVDRDWPFR
jgi:hypothetical protein